MDGSSDGSELFVLVLLLLMAAFFSGSEAAFLALSRTRVRRMKEEGLWGAWLVWQQHRRRPLILTVLLLGVTLANYTAERVATLLAVGHLGPELGPIVAIVVMTIVIIICCEVIPIHIGASAPERVARSSALLTVPVAILLLPVVLVLSFISRGLLYLGGLRTHNLLPGISEEHLKAMIEESEEQGVLEAGERRMLHGVLDFGDQTAAQIMVPRPDIFFVESRETLAKALQLGLEARHSRLPVYDETPDNVIGVLHLKDLLPYLLKGEMDKEVRVVARPAHHVTESLPADELLRQLQHRRQMLALVKDEFGGTAGLVTVEDILEEIVGDIVDEYDVEEPEIRIVSDTELLCDARIGLHHLENYVHRDLPTDEYESLGGLVMDLAGRIPEQGDSFVFGDLTFTVEAVQGPRLEEIRVTHPAPVPSWQPDEDVVDSE